MCLSPYVYRDKTTKELKSAPCQKCSECRYLFSRHIAERIRMECLNNDYEAYFITYTIAQEFYVYTPQELHEYVIRYHKLLRKEEPIKFVYAIEHGDRTGRLHFHEILMTKRKSNLSVFNFITRYYDLGFVEIEKATLKKIHYTVSYLYDGVYKRAYSKGLGKLTDKQLIDFCHKNTWSEIPLYYRRKLQELMPCIYQKLQHKFLYSPLYDTLKKHTKDYEYRDKKLDKLEQWIYARDRYKLATGTDSKRY